MLCRVYGGVDDLFEREAEIQIFTAVAQAGLGPRLLVRWCCPELKHYCWLAHAAAAAYAGADPERCRPALQMGG